MQIRLHAKKISIIRHMAPFQENAATASRLPPITSEETKGEGLVTLTANNIRDSVNATADQGWTWAA